MFLLRRRWDGKWWKNRHSFGGWSREDNEREWTNDPDLCTPFKTRAGALRNRGTSNAYGNAFAYPERRFGSQHHKDYLKREFEVVPCKVTVVIP